MLKYRVEFKSSRILVTFTLLVYFILILSVLNWQSESIQYQFLFQMLTILGIILFFIKTVFNSRKKKQPPVIFSQGGELGWRITAKSRVSSFLIFIHLISSLHSRHSKWCLIYKDQVTKRDFRRLCRAVIYQHQTSDNGNL